MLGTVVICFFVCLLPWRVFNTWLMLASQDDVKRLSAEAFYTTLYFCRIMLYMNSMLNPFLYAVVSSKFRSALWETLCQYCCYCDEYCCCMDDGSLGDEFQKGNAPTGKARRRYRRNRRFLLRQSTFNTTTTTTTTSSSVKTHHFHPHPHLHHPQRTRFSSMDSIWTQHRMLQNRQSRPPMRLQHSLDIEISPTSSPAPDPEMDQNPNSLSTVPASVPTSLAVSRLSPLKESPTPTFSPESDSFCPAGSAVEIAEVSGSLNSRTTLPAEMRRAIMMRRSSRVTVLDDDTSLSFPVEIQLPGKTGSQQGDGDSSPNNSSNPVPIVGTTGNTTGSSVSFDYSSSGSDSFHLPIIERILSDPQISNHESFV